MANRLKMALVQSIQQLHAAGWSQRRIARELGIDRGAVKRHLDLWRNGNAGSSKPAKAPTGSEGPKPATLGAAPGIVSAASPVAGFEGVQAPTGSIPVAADSFDTSGPPVILPDRSTCAAYRSVIQGKVDQGLSATRIRQDLRDELGVEISYYSVRRFVQKLTGTQPLPFRRLECGPGEEAQVDFGTGAPVIGPSGKRQRVYVFRIVLSHSRKAYSEATFTQTTEDFFRCLENAFAHFGGVPQTLVIDNLKAAVAHPDWFDPVLTPKVQSFCQHYGTVILPTKPYMPRHKGKVESGVKYVKNNALKGRTFASLEDQNQFLRDWERNVADTRIHGTTKKQVSQLFNNSERAALLPPPLERFACFHEARRRVNRDGHIEVAKAYYSVPPEYLGREVWVRWDTRFVRVFNHRWEVLVAHVRQEPGRFSTHGEHLAPAKISGLERGAAWLLNKISGLERGAAWLLNKISVIGPQTREWSAAMLHVRGIEGTRVLQGLLSLTKKHASEVLEKACEIAHSHGCYRLRTLRHLLFRQAEKQTAFAFLEEHPVIRPLSDYAAVVAAAHERHATRELTTGFGRQGWAKTSLPAKREISLAAPLSTRPGCADLSPPRPEYPLSGCAGTRDSGSAEPDSVSPGPSPVVPEVRSSTSDSETSDE